MVTSLGKKADFSRASELKSLNLSQVGDGVWKIAGGPDYAVLSGQGVKPTDRIICELIVIDAELFDCGDFESYFGTKDNMATLYKRYAAGHALQIRWWTLPK